MCQTNVEIYKSEYISVSPLLDYCVYLLYSIVKYSRSKLLVDTKLVRGAFVDFVLFYTQRSPCYGGDNEKCLGDIVLFYN
jgi:hypothetical protein